MTDEFNTVLPLALMAVAGLLVLIAVTGRLWIIKFGENSIEPAKPEVTPTTGDEADKAAEKQRKLTVDDAVPEPKSSAQLFMEFYIADPIAAQAADEAWRDWYGSTIADRVVEVRRATGKGNHSWFVKATKPDQAEDWIRVSKGGRGGGVTARRDN